MDKDKARCFISCFEHCWKEVRESSNYNKIEPLYADNVLWTEFMLREETELIGGMGENGVRGFLRRVSERWFKETKPELIYRSKFQWYTMDAYAIEKSAGSSGHIDFINSRVHMIIEHENGEDVETEMWKLLFFRCPLKVLVLYNYNEEVMAANPKKRNWLSGEGGKLDLFNKMLLDSRTVHPEDGSTQYLLIVGNRDKGNRIFWHYWVAEKSNSFEFPSQPNG